jgi:hypothetical protein
MGRRWMCRLPSGNIGAGGNELRAKDFKVFKVFNDLKDSKEIIQ